VFTVRTSALRSLNVEERYLAIGIRCYLVSRHTKEKGSSDLNLSTVPPLEAFALSFPDPPLLLLPPDFPRDLEADAAAPDGAMGPLPAPAAFDFFFPELFQSNSSEISLSDELSITDFNRFFTVVCCTSHFRSDMAHGL
jgi:hypothetical protein